MSRLRVLIGLIVLAVTVLLAPGGAALAGTRLTANISCAAETGAITTWVAGTLLTPGTAPTRVRVEFQRRSGLRVSATASTSLSPLPQPFTVTATTTISGDIAATGYTGTFDPATSLFYRQTLSVKFVDAASGVVYATREATCNYDRRTTVTLTCDQAAGTLTATVTGVDGQAGTSNGSGRPSIVAYRIAQISQAAANGPRFRSENLGDAWEIQHRITQTTGGTWSDTGYVHTITSNPYYYAEELTVGVIDAYGTIVGSGTALCALGDGAAGAHA